MTREEMKAYIRQHYGTGPSASEIGKELGITKNAVLGMAGRLGLKHPDRSPLSRADAWTEEELRLLRSCAGKSRAYAAQLITTRTVSAIERKATAIRLRFLAPAVTREAPKPKRIVPERVFRGDCQWMFGQRPKFRQCDKPAVATRADGSPCEAVWCVEHRARVYQRASVREAA